MKALLLVLVLLAGNAMAQEPAHVSDAAKEAEQQIDSNTARLEVQERMTGNQDFILKLAALLVPIVIFGMQLYQNSKINAVAKSVNGMKDELVASVREAALLKGAETEREAHDKPKRKPKA